MKMGKACLLLALLAAGCAPYELRTIGWSRRQARPGPVCFSPDSQMLAYGVMHKLDYELRLFHGPIHWGKGLVRSKRLYQRKQCRLEVQWLALDAPDRVRTLPLGSRPPFQPIAGLSFSPDSRHLACLECDRITVIEVASGREWKIPTKDHAVTFAWVGPDELAYLSVAASADDLRWIVRETEQSLRPRAQAVWRQKIRPGEQPKRVYAGSFRCPWYHWSDWSPNGRYVVFHVDKRELCLVDVQEGSDLPIACDYEPAKGGNRLAWNPDCSKAFCFTFTEGWDKGPGGDTHQLLLIEPKKRRVSDVTGKFREATGQVPYQTPVWTSDGRNCFVDAHICPPSEGESRAYLVQLDPWRVIRVDERIRQHHPDVGVFHIFALHPLPGWIYFTASRREYLVDYEGRELRKCSPGPIIYRFQARHPFRFGGEFTCLKAISPDGRYRAMSFPEKGSYEVLEVEKLDPPPPIRGAP